jgi:nucleotide sugar dehydrogenase
MNKQLPRFAQHGIGFVGEAVLRAMHDTSPDMDIIGVDVDPEKVQHLATYGIPACQPTDVSRLQGYEVHSFSVPTPCDLTQPEQLWGYDLSYLISALNRFGQTVLAERDDYTLVVIRSTVYPGTTEEVLIPTLEEASGKRCGDDFGVVFNPEFLAQETAYEDALRPPLIVAAGTDARALRLFKECFAGFSVPFTELLELSAAEWLKLNNNVLNAIYISACNEMRENMVGHGLSRQEAQRVMETLVETTFVKQKRKYGHLDLGEWGGACLPKEVAAALQGNQDRRLATVMEVAAQEINNRKMYGIVIPFKLEQAAE